MDKKKLAFKVFCKLPFFVKKSIIKPVTKYNNYKLTKLKTPQVLTFFITSNCNQKCAHCFYSAELNKPTPDLLKIDEIEKFISSFDYIDDVLLTGGEPFLRHDIVSIIKILVKHNVRNIGITTNGYFTKIVLARVSEISEIVKNPINIYVSIDGLREVHDKIRGIPNSFDNTMETIKSLRDMSKVNVNVTTSIHLGNYDDIPGLIKYVKGLNVKQRFQYVRSSWRDVKDIDRTILSGFNPKEEACTIVIPKEDILKLNKIINEYEKDKSQELKRDYFIKHLYENTKMVDCKAGYLDCVIYPNGDIAICEMTIPFANIRDFNFDMKKLWNSEKAGEMKRKTRACFCTHSCNLKRSMYYDEKSLLKITS